MIKDKMLIATHKEWEAATILTTLKNDNLVILKDLNTYGRVISSGHGFYTIKIMNSKGEKDIKCRRNKIIYVNHD